jgi:hypothetical protein
LQLGDIATWRIGNVIRRYSQTQPGQPNRHSAHQIQLLASIIQEQGWRNPVTVSNRSGLIVRGHGRLEAALLIGCEVMFDDDISACVCMVSLRCRRLSVVETIAMLENSAWSARGAGARLFGWHQRSDPRLLQRNDPFGVNHWVGGAVGVVRDEHGGVPKWDELLKCKCDIDATLQELMDNRLVWNEARFCFV